MTTPTPPPQPAPESIRKGRSGSKNISEAFLGAIIALRVHGGLQWPQISTVLGIDNSAANSAFNRIRRRASGDDIRSLIQAAPSPPSNAGRPRVRPLPVKRRGRPPKNKGKDKFQDKENIPFTAESSKDSQQPKGGNEPLSQETATTTTPLNQSTQPTRPTQSNLSNNQPTQPAQSSSHFNQQPTQPGNFTQPNQQPHQSVYQETYQQPAASYQQTQYHHQQLNPPTYHHQQPPNQPIYHFNHHPNHSPSSYEQQNYQPTS